MSDSDEAEVTVEQAIELALELHKAGDLEAANSVYLQVLVADPENSKANCFRGVFLMQNNNLIEALSLFDNAIIISSVVESILENSSQFPWIHNSVVLFAKRRWFDVVIIYSMFLLKFLYISL